MQLFYAFGALPIRARLITIKITISLPSRVSLFPMQYHTKKSQQKASYKNYNFTTPHCTIYGHIRNNTLNPLTHLFFGSPNIVEPKKSLLSGDFIIQLIQFKIKKAWQLPTFPLCSSIIGVRELDFRVRNGNGYYLSTMATRHY